MARSKLAKPTAAAPDPDDAMWAICPEPGCRRERRAAEGRLLTHNMWDGQQMVPCPGSGAASPQGTPPAVFTAEEN